LAPKVLVYADSPVVSTGFGIVIRNIFKRLNAYGIKDITIAGINHHVIGNYDEKEFPYKIIGLMPNLTNDYLARPKNPGLANCLIKEPYIIQRNVQDKKVSYNMVYTQKPKQNNKVLDLLLCEEYDILFVLGDTFIMNWVADYLKRIRFKLHKPFTSIYYFPIDCPLQIDWLQLAAVVDFPVVYNKFGLESTQNRIVNKKFSVIEHGVETEVFQPYSKDKIKDLRAKLFDIHKDKFIIGCFNRNQPRKDIPRLLQIFKQFHRKYPNSVLYLHMQPTDIMGWNLPVLASQLDMHWGEDITSAVDFNLLKGGVSEQDLVSFYNAVDCCISTSVGEGEGLMNIEAMACGKTILLPYNTAMMEPCDAGVAIPIDSGKNPWDFLSLAQEVNVFRPQVSIPDALNKLEKVYHMTEAERDAFGLSAREWVIKNRNWDSAANKWLQIFQQADQLAKILKFAIPKSKDTFVLVRRTIGGFGDMICLLPAIQEVKRTKRIKISVPDQYKFIFKGYEFFEPDKDIQYIEYEVKYSNPCPLAIYEVEDIKSGSNNRRSRIEIAADVAGVKLTDYKPHVELDKAIQEKMALKCQKKTLVFQWKSAETYRDIFCQDEFIEKFLQQYPDWQIGIIQPDKTFNNDRIFVINDIEEAFVLVSCAKLVVSPDSFAVHASAVWNVPCIALYGPIDAMIRVKHYNNVRVLFNQKYLDCYGCNRNCHIPCKKSGKLESSECMTTITADMILERVKEILC